MKKQLLHLIVFIAYGESSFLAGGVLAYYIGGRVAPLAGALLMLFLAVLAAHERLKRHEGFLLVPILG